MGSSFLRIWRKGGRGVKIDGWDLRDIGDVASNELKLLPCARMRSRVMRFYPVRVCAAGLCVWSRPFVCIFMARR